MAGTDGEGGSGENGGGSDLIRAKVTATGAELALSDGLPGLIENLLPGKFIGARKARKALADRLIDKLRTEGDFDDVEVEWAEYALGDVMAKFIRLSRLQQRAAQVYVALPLPPEEQSGEEREAVPKETSSDWLNRFRDDASLVDDEMLAEAYARVLAAEARAPRSVSLRTLGVLKYLDRDVAETFSRMKAISLLIGVPEETDNELRVAIGVSHLEELALIDAGLMHSESSSLYPDWEKPFTMHLPGQRTMILVRRETHGQEKPAQPIKNPIPVRLFTVAGMELMRLTEWQSSPHVRAALLEWLFEQLPADTTLGVAPWAATESPSQHESVSLSWKPWTPTPEGTPPADESS